MVVVPPIKSQGIKTKLVNWISDCARHVKFKRWVEPFTGTGVVAFNVQPKSALLCDSNPHLIEFYQSIQKKKITSDKVKYFLIEEGNKLLNSKGEYYYKIRERFNKDGNPFDFLFLSRSCFNGMMRFNKSGAFNVPFCKKPNRFSQALVTKICNQIDVVSRIIEMGDYIFKHQDFSQTLSEVNKEDLIYCDPPYIGRHVDYFDSWSEDNEQTLYNLLTASQEKFIMSTWLKNKYRTNDYVFSMWANCLIITKEHFYHIGAKETNRNAITEALLINFITSQSRSVKKIDLNRHMNEQLPEILSDSQLIIPF